MPDRQSLKSLSTSLTVKHKTGFNKSVILLPIIGALAFVNLYIIATFYYPGGSQHDSNASGFSWLHNYWCNLLNKQAINGEDNTARPIALAAMLVLCFSLAIFWYLFPIITRLNKTLRLLMQIAGGLSMVTGFFLFTSQHDLMVNAASFFGLIATLITLIRMYQLKWNGLFRLGIFNTGLVLVNNILYYGNGLRTYLPVVQKITFICFLFWICCISYQLYRLQLQNLKELPPAGSCRQRH